MNGRSPVRAVAVEAGRLAALAESAAEAGRLAGPGARVLCWPRGRILPGFWDTHVHIARTGSAARAGPVLYAAGSIAEIVERLAEFARGHPELPAIVARAGNLDARTLAEGRLPAGEDLDRAERGRPVLVADVNKTIANGAARAAAGAGTPGIAWFRAGRELCERFLPKSIPESFAEDFAAGLSALAARGVTAAVEGHARAAQIEAVRRLDAEGRLSCRVVLQPATSWPGDLEDFAASGHRFGEELGPLSRVGPLKILYDLFVMHRTALMSRPYRNQPDNFGRYNIEPEGLRVRLRLARERGFPVAVHVTGDRAAAEAVAAVASEFGARGAPAGSFLIHAYFPPPGLPARMRELGLGLAAQPVFLHHWAETLEDFVGGERAGDFYPLDEYLAAGVTVAAGSDAPICDFDPLAGMYAMTTRKSTSGRVWGPAHALSREQALEAYTCSAARLVAWSGFPGALEVGAPADFVVLSRDPRETPPEELRAIKVLATYVAGRETYRAED